MQQQGSCGAGFGHYLPFHTCSLIIRISWCSCSTKTQVIASRSLINSPFTPCERKMFAFRMNAPPPPPPPEPGSLLDHVDRAKRQMTEAVARAYIWIAHQSPWVASRIDDTVAIASEMERRGYTNHFHEFNTSLLRPLTQGLPGLVRSVRATATCRPNQDVIAAFEMWNVLCFWLAVAIMLLNLLLPFGGALGDFIGVAFRYLATYTLQFAFVRVPTRRWMLIALILLALYTSMCILAVFAVLFLVTAFTSFVSATANGLLLFYSYQIYCSLEDGAGAAMDML